MESKIWTYDSIIEDVALTPINNEKEIDAAAPKLRYFGELLKVYHYAKVEAEKYGYVGVGCITYAEQKLAEYQLIKMEQERVQC